ncbi:Beta-D-glucosyl crocetin beta-1,6-glucosyltransferase [Actinidia chinensis var. chinensis]|uniref:Glycosyltransferase n=1 Tax=Actinidia chinensis var. chinensis TaxID=1590841 RepID=A0A2R6PZ36_ACTCC|nr:Beta-D-glucosyl crocetin beta-1,6-glucosyltransferase [Actinidia chinensis var. chinensis]
MDTRERGTIKVLMLPWLGHGHVSPFLELAKKLTSRKFVIYLCSTPINLSSIKKRVTENDSLSLELVELHLPTLPELPPHHQTTNGLPLHLHPTLKQAFDMSSSSFSNILQTLRPDLVIYDILYPRAAPTVASSYNIPVVQLIPTAAALISYGLHVFQKHGVEFPFAAIQPRGPRRAPPREAPVDDDTKERFLGGIRQSCKMILLNTFRELEGKYIDYLSTLTDKKIVPVGPLVQDTNIVEQNDSQIMQWLGTKDEFSTVFVSFGSEYFLSKEEMEEVAHGLELSKLNFIWVVRFPFVEKIELQEALPKGFLDRLGNRGLVVEDWAPQAQILAHSSTSGFVSHCGWNSILESLKFGVPIIAIPMKYDQPMNGRLVEDVGVAVEVKRDENGKLNREEIAQVIRKVVGEKDGEDVRIKAREFSEGMRMKGEEEIDGLVEELVQLCNEAKLLKN